MFQRIEKVFQLVILLVLTALPVLLLVGLAAALMFLVLAAAAPLLGPDPGAYLILLSKIVGGAVLAVFALKYGVLGLCWLYERFAFVRAAFNWLFYAFVGLIALGGLAQCMDGGVHCTPSRYIDC